MARPRTVQEEDDEVAMRPTAAAVPQVAAQLDSLEAAR